MEDDIDYGGLFEVTPGEGVQEPSGAVEGQSVGTDQVQEPNVPNLDTGGQKSTGQQETAAPDGEEQGPQGQEESVPNSDTTSRSGMEPGQGLDQEQQARAQYEAVVAKARADAQRTIDEAFARSGLKNPYTGQLITTKAEYDAYRERFESERREKILKQTGMSGEEFQQFVQNLPEVQKARETQEVAEQAVRKAQEVAAQVKIEEQIREIGQLDPSIRSLEDLAKMPTYQKFYELVQRGNNFVDAFRLANFDALTQSAAAGARQAAVNAARSKKHLEQTKSRGTGAVSVPAEVKAQYKLFNPDATDEEIQKHYQRNHKEG